MNGIAAVKRHSMLIALVAFTLSVGLVACADRSKTPEQQDRELQQKSAEAAANVKEGARQTAAETKVAADEAKRKLDAIAAGVQEGLNGGPARMDLNTATAASVATLPGIGRGKAEQIVKARPYGSTHELVAKGILSETQYERISDKVTAR